MINGIFAAEYRGGIGFNGTLPWPRNHEDMKYFQELTQGHVVIMGRKTWDDPKMPKPLPDRINYVVTNRPIGHPGVRTIKGDVVQKIKEVQEIHYDKHIFIIGGKELIEKTSILFDNLYITHIKGNYRHDTKIQLDKFLLGFQARSARPSNDRSCTFMVYKNLFRL
jgi:dihydrofolate reductase